MGKYVMKLFQCILCHVVHRVQKSSTCASCKLNVHDLGDKKFLTVQQKEEGFTVNRKEEFRGALRAGEPASMREVRVDAL